MISIIISSYNENFFDNISENISETCGVEYEIIKIENHQKYSLCEAYNLGASQAKFDYFLFLHEDVKFSTLHWGKILLKHLSIKNVGVIGLSGSNYYPNFPGSWWNSTKLISHIIVSGGKERYKYIKHNFTAENNVEPVKGMDGVFLACNRDVFEKNKFDERIKGYHGYDLIFSIRISNNYQNYITGEILLEHFSNGNITKEWIDNIFRIKSIIGNLQNQVLNRDIELKTIYFMIMVMKQNYDSKLKAFWLILTYLNFKDLGFKNYLKALNRLRYLK